MLVIWHPGTPIFPFQLDVSRGLFGSFARLVDTTGPVSGAMTTMTSDGDATRLVAVGELQTQRDIVRNETSRNCTDVDEVNTPPP